MRISVNKWWIVSLIVLLFLIFIAALFIFLKGFMMHTPQIGGKIVDAETGKLIAKANLKVSWEGVYRVIIETVPATYKKEFYQTSNDGTFTIPSYRKFLIPFLQGYRWQEILIYAHSYKAVFIRRYDKLYKKHPLLREEPDSVLLVLGEYERREIKLSENNTLIELKPLKTEEEWWNNIKLLNGYPYLEGEVPQGIEFLVKECAFRGKVSRKHNGSKSFA
jgi:hypothetical protein